MSLNPYRLRHQRKKSAGARRAAKLLSMPDRLIGLILIGNNAVNILAAIIANMLAIYYVGEAAAPWVATATLTILVLVFSEVSPKTIAAQNPEWFAFKDSARAINSASPGLEIAPDKSRVCAHGFF